MLIKSIELTNFRIFSGRQQLDFSTDKEKNVTLIMGDNGSGKTTLAQAFSWCLYGTTTFKKRDELLSFPVRETLEDGKTAQVKVCLTLFHNQREYRIVRSQEYRKDSQSSVNADSPVLSVSYKADDGQEEYVGEETAKTDLINELIPSSISSYFFFDGERVEKMGNEIQNGRSREFKDAVENLLGLSAISEAMRHLKGGAGMVIGSFHKDYNADSDEDYQKAERTILAAEERLRNLEKQVIELKEEKEQTTSFRDRYQTELESLEDSREKSQERVEKRKQISTREQSIASEEKSLMNRFGKGSWRFFSTPLLEKALSEIEHTSLDFKEAPYGVDENTINDLIERKECLCGTPIKFNSKEYSTLIAWLKVVPPEHIGAALSNYRKQCELSISDDSQTLLDDIKLHVSNIRQADREIAELNRRIDFLDGVLANAKDSSDIERNLQTCNRRLNEIEDSLEECYSAIGAAENERQSAVAQRNGLTTNDETNRRIRRDREYAEYIYSVLSDEHSRKEAETRSELEEEINNIFVEFFNGSLQLELDEKYNVRVKNKSSDIYDYDIETSEGQTVAVIFAFIAGVIRLATDEKRSDDEMLITEAYPLVMDAPMSKLDKKRIAAICEVVPKIAEQTVIMIKDTDGDLARGYLSDRIGLEYAVVPIVAERESSIERMER